MYRYKLVIEYDGSAFSGWQRQQDCATVQAAIETAFQKFCVEPAILFAAGRTDAGVHAYGQVAHVSLNRLWASDKIRGALNFYLRQAGHAIAVLDVEQVSLDFHARFSAKKRHYIYKIINRSAPCALEARRAWQIPYKIDVAKMQEAAKSLIGYHDFTTFRASACQAKTPWRSVEKIEISQEGDRIELLVSAPSFLHNQIRSFMGSLVEVGRGKWPVEGIKQALHAVDRARCGPVAPPYGLYFYKVDY